MSRKDKFFWAAAVLAILAVLSYGILREIGHKFTRCVSGVYTDTVCDSCAHIYTPYILKLDDGSTVLNFK